MKRNIFYLAIILLVTVAALAYNIPYTRTYIDGGVPATPDSVWVIFAADGVLQDSSKINPTSFRHTQTFSKSYSCDVASFYDRVHFSSGRTAYGDGEYDVNILDSLNSLSAELTNAIDSINGVIDSLQEWDDDIGEIINTKDSVYAILDSIQLYLDAAISALALEASLTNAIDSINGILDTLQLWDDDIDLLVAMKDSIYAVLDSVQLYLDGTISGISSGQDTTAIKTMLENNPATFVMVPTDTAEGGGSIGSTGQDTTAIKTMISNNPTLVKTDVSSLALEASVTKALDSLAKIIDSLENLDNWGAHQTTSDSIFDSLIVVYDSLFAVLDSIQNQDDWVAHQSTVDSALNSLNSISAELAKSLDSLAKIIDSTENYDNWIASATELSKSLDSLGKIVDSLEALSGYSIDIIDTLYRYVDSIDALVSSAGGTAAISDGDMSAIIDTLFARLVSDTLTGTYLSALLVAAGSASGGGAFTVNVYVLDSSDSDAPVTDAPVFANNTAQSMSNPYFDLTDNNGLAVFQLDAADWALLTNKAGYNSLCDTQTVSATLTCSLLVYSSSANKTPVYGILQQADGTRYASAEIRIDLIAYPRDSLLTFHDTLVTQTIVYDTANVNGYWSANLYSNDSLSDSSYYKLTFRDQYGNRIIRESNVFVHVPQSDTAINFYNLDRKREETGAW